MVEYDCFFQDIHEKRRYVALSFGRQEGKRARNVARSADCSDRRLIVLLHFSLWFSGLLLDAISPKMASVHVIGHHRSLRVFELEFVLPVIPLFLFLTCGGAGIWALEVTSYKFPPLVLRFRNIWNRCQSLFNALFGINFDCSLC